MRRLSFLFLVAGLVLVGCAPSGEADEDSGSSSDEVKTGSGLTVIEIDQPLDFTREEDWSRGEVEVLQRFDTQEPRWVPANKVQRPGISSTIQDGFGSGPCRFRANPFKKEIGFRCRWTF